MNDADLTTVVPQAAEPNIIGLAIVVGVVSLIIGLIVGLMMRKESGQDEEAQSEIADLRNKLKMAETRAEKSAGEAAKHAEISRVSAEALESDRKAFTDELQTAHEDAADWKAKHDKLNEINAANVALLAESEAARDDALQDLKGVKNMTDRLGVFEARWAATSSTWKKVIDKKRKQAESKG